MVIYLLIFWLLSGTGSVCLGARFSIFIRMVGNSIEVLVWALGLEGGYSRWCVTCGQYSVWGGQRSCFKGISDSDVGLWSWSWAHSVGRIDCQHYFSQRSIFFYCHIKWVESKVTLRRRKPVFPAALICTVSLWGVTEAWKASAAKAQTHLCLLKH